MAVKPVQLFSSDPGHLTDFTGLNIADVFNRIAVQRANSLEQKYVLPEEPEDPKLPPLREDPDVPQMSVFSGDEDYQFQPPERPDAGILASTAAPAEDPPDYNRPAISGTRYADPVDFTFNSEAQRDSNGKLRVYQPPSGDGGGAFEVAGITARYQPKEAARLKSMIEAGDTAGAEAAAKEFFRQRAAPFTSQTANQGLRLQFTDTVHHRGEGGLRRILQRATGSDSKSYGELIHTLEADPKALESFNRARQDYEWEEVDRGRESRKKFRRGLQNRFDRAYQASLQF